MTLLPAEFEFHPSTLYIFTFIKKMYSRFIIFVTCFVAFMFIKKSKSMMQKIQLCITGINYILKYIQIENSFFEL